MSFRSPAFTWRPYTLQFGHGCGAVEICYSDSPLKRLTDCFNSATAAEPWRSQRVASTSGLMQAASIRPRLRSRGDLIEVIPHVVSAETLQFGHGCGAVEMKPAAAMAISVRALQFGHGCGAVEISPGPPSEVFVSAASIRPRLRSRGDLTLLTPGEILIALRFNSATAAEPWRCVPDQPDQARLESFNSATAAEPWR